MMQDFNFALVVTLILVLACSLALFAALYAGALVILSFSEVSQNACLSGIALKSLKCAIQRLVLFNVNFRHLFHSLHIRQMTL